MLNDVECEAPSPTSILCVYEYAFGSVFLQKVYHRSRRELAVDRYRVNVTVNIQGAFCWPHL
jgi:hypothetical protein